MNFVRDRDVDSLFPRAFLVDGLLWVRLVVGAPLH